MGELRVLLSFDIEEFDMPLEYGKDIPMEDQIEISTRGASIALDLLRAHQIKATFFSTVVFATQATPVIERLLAEGHELASHGYFHSSFEPTHLLASRLALEKISGQDIKGFRMPRMKHVSDAEIQRAGYTYNSSLNPIYLPGRYNNFFMPRTLFRSHETFQLPASATPLFRFPLFWLSFHNFPLGMYKAACRKTINKDKYLNIYFHPWEFTALTDTKFGLPWYVSKNSGLNMIKRFDQWLLWLTDQHYTFSTITQFLNEKSFLPGE
ncbi:MAG TPA: polysaccharide deacetylase family protein [Chryseolinea sp.]|nr:polysaccharide deacetylase family protein [Chryseolinea sp.]